MALASWQVGALPVGWRIGRAAQSWSFVGYYLGLASVIAGWLLLGRAVLKFPNAGQTRHVVRFACLTALPLLAAAPLGRDLWAYAAQGHLLEVGVDPYRHGPSAAPGGLAAQVDPRWAHTPSPYGPGWLQLGRLAITVARHQPILSVLVLRLPSYLGLLLCCWAVSHLARRLSGGDSAVAVWLGVANPLMIVLGVGGGHNDVLMLGLALAGLAIATRPGWAWLVLGTSVAAVAVVVKSPALLAVAFIGPLWSALNQPPKSRRPLAVSTVVTGIAIVVVVVVTAATGLGYGWVRQTSPNAPWVSWLSLPSAAAMLIKAVAGHGAVGEVDGVMRACRVAGAIVLLVVVALAWLAAARRPRRSPTDYLALAWAAAAVLAPAVQPWYLLWATASVAVARRRHAMIVGVSAIAVAFTVMITPSGHGWESDARGFAVLVAAVALCTTALPPGGDSRRRPPAAGRISARSAGSRRSTGPRRSTTRRWLVPRPTPLARDLFLHAYPDRHLHSDTAGPLPVSGSQPAPRRGTHLSDPVLNATRPSTSNLGEP